MFGLLGREMPSLAPRSVGAHTYTYITLYTNNNALYVEANGTEQPAMPPDPSPYAQ